jgi:Fe-S cluster assembly protein SufD
MNAALTSRIAEEYAAATRERLVPADARRAAAIAALAAQGLPTTRDENWKYASLRALERQRFVPAAASASPDTVRLPSPVAGFERYVFVDGRFAPGLSAEPGALFSALAAASEPVDATTIAARGTDQRLALLNEAFATDGARLKVAAGAAPARLELVFVAQADEKTGPSYPRLQMSLAAGTTLELIERHVSAASAASFVNSALEIELGRGARLTHYRLQELSSRCTLFDTLNATLATEAAYHLHAISTGALAARSTQTFRLAGEQAQLCMAIAALGDGPQVQDSFALVEHLAPRARTEQLFRGIAAGRARVAFNGKIVVAKHAAGTDSRQSLRGLLAGAQAEIDARPQLEIYTDDVRCSHGASVGKLDDNMLFYLLSRGLDQDTAQRLLKWAFLADAFARINVPELRRQIEETLAEALRDSALKELL